MQIEMKHPCCPLCKRRLGATSAAAVLDSKLCEQCQAMVQTALRREASPYSAPAVASQSSVIARVQQSMSPLDQAQFEFPEDGSTSGSWFELQPQSPILFEQDDDVGFSFEHEGSHYIDETADRNSPDAAANGSRKPEYGMVDSSSRSVADGVDAKLDYAEADDSIRLEQSGTVAEQGLLHSLVPSVNLAEGQAEESEALRSEASTDPWGNPLPAWDYSRNEWPVLLGPERQSSVTKHRSLVAALVLVALAAAVYFLTSRTGSPERRANATTASPAPEPAPAVNEPGTSPAGSDADAQNQAPQPASQAAASVEPKPDQTEGVEMAASNGSSNASGRFSLQAAAFPTQDGADEFAEKLRRAGVPSYVVAADIARRGRWFRVRVGRFNSAEEAQRFAVEAQIRGKAAGLALQLVGCQYEQP